MKIDPGAQQMLAMGVMLFLVLIGLGGCFHLIGSGM